MKLVQLFSFSIFFFLHVWFYDHSYKFDAPKGKKLKVFRKIHIKSLNPDDFITKQVFYHSKDGTRVPMFITHHKNFKQDGTAPAIQSGYVSDQPSRESHFFSSLIILMLNSMNQGGFAYNFPIRFNPTIMTFVARFGGVHAVALIRGGGEYGEEWHKEAMWVRWCLGCDFPTLIFPSH